MIFVLFCCAYFDFIQFILSIYTKEISSFNSKFGGLQLISDSLFYCYVLKLHIMRHQIFYIIVIGILSLIPIITEFIFLEINIFYTYSRIFISILFSLLYIFFNNMIGVNEKYLYEFNNMNPFYSLLFEGFFGLLFSLVYDLCNDSSKKINEFIKNKTSSEFAILIFCLIIYRILNGLKNLYRVNTTKIFTPMTTSAFDFFFIPIE